MTADELQEYAGMVKALDKALERGQVAPALWPLCRPAAGIVSTIEATVRYTCPMCKSVVNNHPCQCPVSSCKRGLRKRSGVLCSECGRRRSHDGMSVCQHCAFVQTAKDRPCR